MLFCFFDNFLLLSFGLRAIKENSAAYEKSQCLAYTVEEVTYALRNTPAS